MKAFQTMISISRLDDQYAKIHLACPFSYGCTTHFSWAKDMNRLHDAMIPLSK